MHSKPKLFLLLGIALAASAQTPAVNPGGVVNVASFVPAVLPNGDVAQGSMVVIFGTAMGPATLKQATAYPLPTSLAGTSVRITSGNTVTDAILLYTSAAQLAAIIPSATPTGPASLVVTYNGNAGAPAAFNVAANSFGIFSLNQGGNGPGIVADANSRVFGMTTAANPGDAAVIWGTGLGAVAGNEAAGALPGDIAAIPVEVLVGGQPAQVLYRGRSGCCAGVDQISFVVPNTFIGCRVPVAVKINNVVSNYTTMPIAATGTKTCSDPDGPSATDVARYSANGLSLGFLNLARLSEGNTSTDIGNFTFYKYTAAQVNSSPNPFTAQSLAATPVGTCMAFPQSGGVPGQPAGQIGLDAGASFSVAGSGGTKAIPLAIPGLYGDLLASGTANLFLNPGSFLVTGPGGAAVGPVSATIVVPATLVWSNIDAVTNINRSKEQLITWTGGDPTGTISIFGYAYNVAIKKNGVFVCTAKAGDGQFIIPASAMLSLPASGTSTDFVNGSISLTANTALKPFTARGLDAGFAVSSQRVTKSSISFQ